jgi:pterin-4a-carbinolamine dehydratase
LEVAKIDNSMVVKQHPTIMLTRKDLLTIELTTPKLKGMSHVDLQLAV